MIRIQFRERDPSKLTPKKWAFVQSVQRNLRSRDTLSKIPHAIWIHPHHFPTALLEWRRNQRKRNLITPLTLLQAKEISTIDNGLRRMFEQTNSVLSLHNKNITKLGFFKSPISAIYSKTCVQSPFATMNEIKLYISSITNRVTTRRIKYDSLTPLDKESHEPASADQAPSNAPAGYSLMTVSSNDITALQSDVVTQSMCTIQQSTSVIPTKDTLFGVLIATFTKCKGNSDTFKVLPEVQNIAKLLHRYYEHDSPFHLGSDSMIYYPCNKGNYSIKNDGCKYFNVYNRIYQHAVFCDSCTEGNIAEVREKIVS